jgi:hypothetical protein
MKANVIEIRHGKAQEKPHLKKKDLFELGEIMSREPKILTSFCNCITKDNPPLIEVAKKIYAIYTDLKIDLVRSNCYRQ